MDIQNKQYIVYMHINKINNKKYIGLTSQTPQMRWQHGEGYNNQQYFYRAIQKYGWDNFEHIILAEHLTLEEAKLLEQQYIQKYKSNNSNYGYNQTPGGDYPCERTPEIKQKISNSLKQWYQTPEGAALKQLISQTNKGRVSAFKGKHHTPEAKKKMSQAHKQLTGEKAPVSIPILMLDENNNILKEFASKQEALNFLHIVCYKTLTKAIEQHIKYKGYYWKIKE